MNVGIVGLGLIGGSMAKAYSGAGHTVFGTDTDSVTLGWAKLSGIVSDGLTVIGACELILLAVPPEAAVRWLEEHSPEIGSRTMVVDLCGTKRRICKVGFALAEQYGYTFVGGHPMAGNHLSGIKHSRGDLFRAETMVIVPPRRDDISLYDRIKQMLAPAGFGRFTFTTAEEHDRMIAYTSQLAHVVSSAYVKSPRALSHSGMSAGSYRDMTRVARLNEEMWSELFLENRDNLTGEIDLLIGELTKYRRAMADDDPAALTTLLREGRLAKEKAD